MRKPDSAFKFTLLVAAAVLLASSTWAVKSWQQLTASAVNGVAFYDCNGNGVRDNNEAAFSNMTVYLSGTTTTGGAVNVSTTTDNAGNYGFVGIEAGTFTVQFTFPTGSTGLSFTTKNPAVNGSDVDATGLTDAFSTNGATSTVGGDAGVIDRIAPVVTFMNPFLTPYANGDTITVECDNLPRMNATWASATDNSGAAIAVQFIDLAISTNDCRRNGYITILNCIWRATDLCGNVGEKAVLVKIKDSKAPVFTSVPSDVTVNTTRGEVIPTASGVSAIDNCAANPVAVTVVETEVLNTCGKVITRTWSASDDCGNIGRGTQRITVISNATCSNGGGFVGDTVRLILKQNQTIDTCFSMPAGSVMSNIQHCSAGQPSAAITLTASNCIRVVPSVNYIGIDTFCARVCDANGLNCRDMKLILNIQALRLGSCNILNGMTDVNLTPRVCGENACYCIVGTDVATLRDNYTVTDNGRPYDGGFGGCQFDTIFSYNYFAVPVMGTNGPYSLDYWRVNGTTRTIASFQNVETLADSMNRWDPMGNWRIDPTRFLIYGGDTRSQYGEMKITRLSNQAFGLLELNTGLISNGVKVCFSRGLHTIIFQNTISGCADTLRANVFCSDVRSAPVAVDDRVSTSKNTPIRIAATFNDTLNGLFESLVGLTQPTHGSVGFQDAKTFLYTPNTDFCGRDSFDYRVCNAFGLCDTGRIFVETTCTNGGGSRPVAVDDVANTRLNTSVTIAVLANDLLNGTLTRAVTLVRFQSHGTVNITNNQVTYTPSTGFCNGRDSFDYEICNAFGCDTARVVVTVTCEGDTLTGGMRKPVAVNDFASTFLNRAVTILPLLNDTINGNLLGPLSIIRFQMRGAVNITNNQIVYTPSPDFCNGKDTLSYSICNANGCDTADVVINVACDGDPLSRKPVAVNDTATTRTNTSVTILAFANDTFNGALIGQPRLTRLQMNGTVNIVNNQIIYTPMSGFCNGRDTFDYEICNLYGCDTAQVIVSVLCVNERPNAVDDRATTQLNNRVTIPVLANDVLNGFMTGPIRVVRNPIRGTSFISNNQIVYIPNATFCGGNDTLDYEICNATGCDTASVIVTITCGNDTTGGGLNRRPVAVDDRASTRLNTQVTISPLANDTLNGVLRGPLSIIGAPLHGLIFLMNNQIIYTPTNAFCGGNDTLNYEICNANGCDTGQIVIAVSCDNGLPKPIAVDDAANTRVNTSVTVNVLSNDNTNGALVGPLSITRFQTHGSATIINNQIIYAPASGYCNANDTLEYQICNANGCDTGRLIISIACDTVNTGGGSGRVVVAVNDNVTTRKNTSVTFRPTLNDTIRTKLLSLMITAMPRNGSIAFRGLDTLVYVPNVDFCGRDSLKYMICDTSFICSEASIYFNVTCGNDTIIGGETRKPNALNDFATTQKGRPVTISVLTNDSTYGVLTRPVMVIRTPRNGTASVQNNQIVYTPNPLFCGSQDTFKYEICNANGCDTADVYVAVTCDTTTNGGGSMRPIVAVDDNISTRKNMSVRFRPTLNDTIRTKLLALSIITAPRNGTIAFQGLDTLLYLPNLNFCGRDTIQYTICDTSFRCSNAFIFINVTCDSIIAGEMRKPVALNDFATTQKGRAVTISVLTNDSTYGVLTRPVTVLRAPRNGTTSIQNNQIVYTPNPMYCGGQDSLTYEICNINGCDTANVYVSVTCDTTVNNGGSMRQIVAVNDRITTPKNTQIKFNPTVNDTIRKRLLALMIINTPRNGTISFVGLDTLIYAPNRDFCGRDTFEYSICDTSFNCASAFIYVNVTCDSIINNLPLPIAVNDTARVGVNQSVVIDVLLNDTLNGVLRGPLSITTQPRFGTATRNSNNQIVYTPNAGFCGGRDTLKYEICNANGCSTATVSINVVCDSITLTRLPIAVPDYATTRKRTPIRINILRNDTLNGTLDSIRIVAQPRRGMASIGADNVLTYSSDTCGFVDTLVYRICNRNGCDTALVAINVTCDSVTNNLLLPIAVNDTARLGVNQSVIIDVLLNDTLNGVLRGPLSITTPPRFGTATVNGANQIVYKPNPGFCGGRDTVKYQICNANGCSTAIVSIFVACDSLTATLPPVAVFDMATTPKNTPIRIAILANDTLNGTLDSIKIIRSPLLGIASLGSDNVLTYTPDSCGFTDSLIYRICNRNGCDTAIVRIKVTCDSINANLLPPVAVFDTARTAKGQTVTIRVTLNDTLRGADTFRITRRPLHGLATFDASRQIAYKPDSLYCGNDTLIYEICNNRGCDTALVTIKVTCDTMPTVLRPVAVDDRVRTMINRRVDFVILGNDTLRGARFAEMTSPPSHGTIIIMPDSMAMYKPDKEFCGPDSFSYRICNSAGCDTAIVRIEVECGDTLQVFRGFSPNNDGKNDRFVIRGIENFPDNEVIIMNRWGNQVFSRKGYRNEDGWDGDWNGKHVPDGTYFYCIRLNDPKNQQFTGYFQLMR
jgi:large repetitive protein